MKILALLLLAFAIVAWSWRFLKEPEADSAVGGAPNGSPPTALTVERQVHPSGEADSSARMVSEQTKADNGHGDVSGTGIDTGATVGGPRSAFGRDLKVDLDPERPRRSAFRQDWTGPEVER